MDNCDTHGRSSSTGSEIKRVYEYSTKFAETVLNSWWYFRVNCANNETIIFHGAQTVGENFLADPFKKWKMAGFRFLPIPNTKK